MAAKMPTKIIERLCHKLLGDLKEKGLVHIKVPEPTAVARMVKAFEDDLGKEATLERDARQMLEKYRDAIERGEIDEHKMYLMIRKQLIKERKLVI